MINLLLNLLKSIPASLISGIRSVLVWLVQQLLVTLFGSKDETDHPQQTKQLWDKSDK